MNSLIVSAGMPFYTYEKIPKVWRRTYSPDRERVRYVNTARYVHPFDLFQADVTDHYCRTADVTVRIDRRKAGLKDRYVYIATIRNQGGPQWNIMDFSRVRRGKACFHNMGREVLYIALGYDGSSLVPVSDPFMLKKDGTLEFIHYDRDTTNTISMDLRRKYPESYNVVDQRRKLLGARIQCATRPDFSDALTLFTIETTDIPDRIELPKAEETNGAYRYWRYLAVDGTYGSIAELAFFQESAGIIQGTPTSCADADAEHIRNAFDGDWLTNFETENPDGNWVGMDFGKPVTVSHVRVVPRSDDNDICPGNEYELYFFDGNDWRSLGYRMAEGNTLHYDDIPLNTLLWMRNYTRGHDERPFMVKVNGDTEWW